MKLYMKKTWGFDNPSGPLQFSEPGAMRTALETIQPEDRVVIVGTQELPTAEEDQGKLLGMMEVAAEPVSSLDFYDLVDVLPIYRDENGNYRWPYGLRVRRAWQFDESRSLSEFCDRGFGRQGVIGITPLTDEEAARIMQLPRHEIGVRGAEHRPAQAGASRKGRSGPPPSTTRAGVMHLRSASAFTYAMAIEGASQPLFKIGWAFDTKVREQQFNRASLPDVGGLRYKVVLSQYWTTAKKAFQMEQTLLRKLADLRHEQNCEVVGPLTLAALERMWGDYIFRAKRGQ